ncbi:MAG: electron transfer flavoprotein subunit beta [Lentisphaerae bacterium RIFOXYA12_FULL_48_11]|nr:MAG: electron transfer flavoprotein subunit beta [Lentisphaerae bacterium RIFOXYA12_FULL_48_11]
MKFNIVVLVKQVPDTKNVTGQAMKEDGTVNRAALPAIFNPEDMNALEAALMVKDQHFGSKVTVLTMGPPAAIQVLKESLYRGADEVALISDKRFAAADTLATSYALRCAIINKVKDYDLVFCGRQAIDGDTAQVGPQTAEKLGVNQITCVSEIQELTAKEITCRRTIEGGFEVVRCKLPVLCTFTDENFKPRPASAKLVMAHKNAALEFEDKYDESYIESARSLGKTVKIDLWNVETIGADPASCGLSGSPTKVKKIDSVVLKGAQVKQVSNTDEGIAGMMQELIVDHTLG